MKSKFVIASLLIYATLSVANLLFATEPSTQILVENSASDHVTGCDELYKLPPEDSLTVFLEERVEFKIMGFENEEDTLLTNPLWTLNRRRVTRDTSAFIIFPELGVFRLVAAVIIGIDIQRFEWIITVIPPLGIDPGTQVSPVEFELHSAYPNPFNSTTTLSFTLPRQEVATLKVYDLSGREVAMLHTGLTLPGVHRTTWDASDVAAGVYFIRLDVAGNTRMQKIMLMK